MLVGGPERAEAEKPRQRSRLSILLLLAAAPILVFLLWGPLLVTSPGEALSAVQNAEDRYFGGLTYGDVVRAHEAAVGAQGEWSVKRNEFYDSFFEGDRGGFFWIVTYNAPGTDETRELEFFVKRYTGDISLSEPNWSFLPEQQLQEYLARGKE
ncbi:MAG TPA: hypothetical protein VFE20_07620 [Thermoleophilia bacterium]|nr:hypothetical protein [Thermoleophilia bacterium]